MDNGRDIKRNNVIDEMKKTINLQLKKLLSIAKGIDCDVDVDGDEGDLIQGAFILHMAQEQNDRNNAKIIALYEAAKKIDNGEYGICEECGEEILYKRLLICPEAKFCIKCAEEQEKELKLYYNRNGK